MKMLFFIYFILNHIDKLIHFNSLSDDSFIFSGYTIVSIKKDAFLSSYKILCLEKNEYSRAETVIHRKTCLQCWPVVGIWKLGYWEDFHHSFSCKSRLLGHRLFAQTICCMLNTCFPSKSLTFWYIPSRGCLCDQPQVKTLDTESLLSIPEGEHLTGVVKIVC